MDPEIEFSTKEKGLMHLNEIFSLWNNKISKMTEHYATTTSIHAHRSIKDDIVHLWIWQRVSVARMEAGLSQSEPTFDWWPEGLDPESEADLEQINDWIYDSFKDKAWSEVYRDWHSNFSRLISLTEQINEDILLDSSKFKWLNGHPLRAVLYGTYEHHKEHFEKFTTLSLK